MSSPMTLTSLAMNHLLPDSNKCWLPDRVHTIRSPLRGRLVLCGRHSTACPCCCSFAIECEASAARAYLLVSRRIPEKVSAAVGMTIQPRKSIAICHP